MCNFLPVREDLREAFGAQDIPQGGLCQEPGGGVGVGDVCHGQGGVLHPVINHSIHVNCHWVLGQDLKSSGESAECFINTKLIIMTIMYLFYYTKSWFPTWKQKPSHTNAVYEHVPVFMNLPVQLRLNMGLETSQWKTHSISFALMLFLTHFLNFTEASASHTNDRKKRKGRNHLFWNSFSLGKV